MRMCSTANSIGSAWPDALKAVVVGPAMRDSQDAERLAVDSLAKTGLPAGSVPVLKSRRSYRSFKPRPQAPKGDAVASAT